MAYGPFGMKWPDPAAIPESRDGAGCGDHDAPYTFGEQQTVACHPKFTIRDMARLLVLRSQIRNGDRQFVDVPQITAPVE